MKSILVDSGVLYALADQSDRWHGKCRTFLEKNLEVLIAPVTVLPEVCYFLNKNLGPGSEIEFIRSCMKGEIEIENLVNSDIRRSLQVMQEFIRHKIGFVDASIVAVAERLGINRVLTIDRRHFSLFRPRHCPGFLLLP